VPANVPFTHSLLDAPHFAMGGAIFKGLKAADIEMTARLGFKGIEPYRGMAIDWLDRPLELKRVLDQNGISMVTCSNGGAGQLCEFLDPAQREQTLRDHVAFARDFLAVFGCKHFKMNMGRRRASGTTDADVQAVADTLNELGRRIADLGILVAPHPHIWGPVERQHEIEGLMALTDPTLVYLTPDTAHVNLGGGDPVMIVDKYWNRIAALHWKDSKASYRGYTGPTPTTEMHAQEILYKDLGSGGVDHEAIWKIIKDRGYRGWITLDLDPPRSDEGTIEEKILINRRYLTDTLKVATL
jgi:inosose dehydratase